MSYIPEEEFNKKVDLRLWKRLLQYALRWKKLLAGVVVCLFTVSFVDILYPLLSKYAIDHFVEQRTTSGILTYVLVTIGMIILQSICSTFFVMGASDLEMRISYDIRQDCFLKLQKLSFSYYDKTSVGYIMARVISDTGRLSEMIAWSIVDILLSCTFIVGCVIAMFSLNARLAAITLAVLPLLAAAVVFFRTKILRQYRVVRSINSRITGAYNEGIMGAMTTKTLVRERQNFEDFQKLTLGMRRARPRI